MIDFHCHLDLYSKPQTIIERADRSGVYVLSVTTIPKAWLGTKRLAKGRRRIRTALGFHPELAHERHNELELFDTLVDEAPYVGEIGLDGSQHLREYAPIQRKVFAHVLRATERVGGRIMSIHSRGAADEVLDLLRAHEAGLPVLHWFTGGPSQLRRAVDTNCWFSVGPAMLKSKAGRDRVAAMPRDRCLPETDGPFGKVKGRPLEPTDADSVVITLAEIWSMSPDNVRQQFIQNFKNILSLAGTQRY
ncbi:Qat anti-phage system TatD family nuclease QatD [Roseivivax sp. THAF30]|uniref:Qat anti-phage system TatD family nuclease QatD n=1 Tax=Roseivivax sp. THAF30 TaxID=2587852 RepID=UPI00126865C2|nr:Qat anti-phage system TatD family nuclease QatD [Roseivivax sp. THAF30]QFT61759.1 putative deoxyribonuclease YjjV [Roseivivax sp. THAF30]